MFITKPIH